MGRRPVPEETKQTLLDHFWKIYCEKPIEKITVREITDAAGFNRGTFYVYFTDVYNALQAIEDSILPGEEQFEEMIKDHHKGLDRHQSLEEFMDFYEQHGEKLQVLLGPNGDPTFVSRIKERVRRLLIPHSSELHKLNEKDRMKFEYMVEAEISSRLGIFTLWFSRGKDLPLEDLHQLVYDMEQKGSHQVGQEMLHRNDFK
jgi:AcrR family transcriptional regulator